MRMKAKKVNKAESKAKPKKKRDLSKQKKVALKHKLKLLDNILEIIEIEDYYQRDVAKILGQQETHLSSLLNGDVDSVSIDKLVYYLETLGANVEIEVEY